MHASAMHVMHVARSVGDMPVVRGGVKAGSTCIHVGTKACETKAQSLNLIRKP